MKFPLSISSILPNRFWQQILLIMGLVATIPLIILGMNLVSSSQKTVTKFVLRDTAEIAKQASGQISEFIQSPQKALIATASILGRLDADPWLQETSIVELSLRYPLFERISVVDLNGQEVVTSQLGTGLKDFSSSLAFQKASSGELFMSDVSVSVNYVPMMQIALPIFTLGKVSAILLSDVNLRTAWNAVDSIRIGERGYAFLFDYEGHYLSHRDKKKVLKREIIPDKSIIEKIKSGEYPSENLIIDGEKVIISFTGVDGIDWGLAVVQSEKEVYAPLKSMTINSIIIITLTAFTVVLISIAFSHYVSRPVNRLITASQSIAQNDLEISLPESRKDEMGDMFRAFNQMIKDLKRVRQMEKLSTIGQAANALAHDLKNSLVQINTYIQLLPERYEDKEFINDFMMVVPNELRSWKEMLSNINEFSKPTQLDEDPVNIRSIVYEFIALIEPQLKQLNIDVEYDIDVPDNNMIINAFRLKQVFLNLIMNAVQATPEGGLILIESFIEENDIRSEFIFSVQNTGSYIAQDKMEKIFEPFETTKQSGMGLGLAICREVITAHGGDISVISDQEEGTTFKIVIPIVKK